MPLFAHILTLFICDILRKNYLFVYSFAFRFYATFSFALIVHILLLDLYNDSSSMPSCFRKSFSSFAFLLRILLHFHCSVRFYRAWRIKCFSVCVANYFIFSNVLTRHKRSKAVASDYYTHQRIRGIKTAKVRSCCDPTAYENINKISRIKIFSKQNAPDVTANCWNWVIFNRHVVAKKNIGNCVYKVYGTHELHLQI